MEHSTHWKVGAVRWKDDRRSSGLRLAKEAEAVLLAASQDMMVYVFQDASSSEPTPSERHSSQKMFAVCEHCGNPEETIPSRMRGGCQKMMKENLSRRVTGVLFHCAAVQHGET